MFKRIRLGGDDCPICRAMKAAQEQGRELTREELEEAFRKAKEGGAITGGNLIFTRNGVK
ncbi:MAG: hypothetical protein V1905_03120 [bacterium]